jgi:hypothetical protein
LPVAAVKDEGAVGLRQNIIKPDDGVEDGVLEFSLHAVVPSLTISSYSPGEVGRKQ